MQRSLAVLSITFALAGCAKKEAPPVATSTTTPALPSDVQSVAAASSTSSAATTSTIAASPASSVAPAAADASATTPATATSDASGTIVATGEFASPVRSELAVKLPGRVAKMYVDEGSRVERGQPVLELETDYVRLNLQRANADTARAKAVEDDARRDLDRKKELIAKDSIPRAVYDRSQAAYDQAVAARQAAVAQGDLLRQQIGDAVLRSPISGVIAEKRTDVGQRLGDNTVAVVIAQTSPLKLRFRVPERYLAQVRKGQSVKASVDPYPGEAFNGQVTVVGGVIDPSTRSLLVETEFPNRDGRLRPGLFARVELTPGK